MAKAPLHDYTEEKNVKIHFGEVDEKHHNNSTSTLNLEKNFWLLYTSLNQC